MNLIFTKNKSNTAKKDSKYLVLLIDKKTAKLLMVHSNGAVERTEEFSDGQVPKKVKHGDDNWDAQDKIFRHIEDHLYRHLELISQKASSYAEKENIAGILIGGHSPLFAKIKQSLKYPLSRKVKGTFLLDMKAPFNRTLERIKTLIDDIEKGK